MFIELELLEDAASNEQTGGVSGCPVGESVLDAITSQLVGVCCAENLVARDFRGHDLADDIAVGETNDQTIFGGIVFILGLGGEALASIVVRLSRSTPLVLGLVAAGKTSDRCKEPRMRLDILTCNRRCS